MLSEFKKSNRGIIYLPLLKSVFPFAIPMYCQQMMPQACNYLLRQ